MRLKLVPNHHFDPHLEASALRDNLGECVVLGPPSWYFPSCLALNKYDWPHAGEAPMTPTEEASLPLAVTKEAKISTPPEELLEDQLGEDELAVPESL